MGPGRCAPVAMCSDFVVRRVVRGPLDPETWRAGGGAVPEGVVGGVGGGGGGATQTFVHQQWPK